MSNQNLEYMDTKDTAAYLRVSRQWLEIGRSKGYGPPFIKPGNGSGGIVRYKRSEIDRWMLDHQHNPNLNPNPITEKE